MDRSDLPIEAVKINGQYIEDAIEGYKTVITSGREGVTPELTTYSVGAADGETVKGSRIPARVITVEFGLQASGMEALRQKLEHLSNLLSVGEADFVFNDEPDRFYTGIPLLSTDFKPYKNAATGSYTVYCAYPFKRSVDVITLSSTDEEGVVIDGNTATFTFDYNGTYPARPLLRAEFTGALSGGDYSDDGDCGFIAWMDEQENIIQLGNPDAIDLDEYTLATQLINHKFTNLTGWETTGSITTRNYTDIYWNKGAGQTMSFAGGTGTLKKSTTGAMNFTLAVVQRLCVNHLVETGTFECAVINSSSNKITAGYRIEKTGNGAKGTVKYIVNDKVVGTDAIDLVYYNTNFGHCKRDPVYTTQKYTVKVTKTVGGKKKTVTESRTRQVQSGYKYTQSNLNSSIKKTGSSVTFKIGGLAARTFTDTDLELVVSQDVKFTFTSGTNEMFRNAVASVRFTSEPSGTFTDIPNVFTAGDIVEADCNDATVYLMHEGTVEGHPEPQYGALGNDWEGFVLNKGQNIITAVWSDWVQQGYEPVIKIIYNEVFL